MSDFSWFCVDGSAVGFIMPLMSRKTGALQGFIPQSIEPYPVEHYEQMSSEDILGLLDQLVIVFPTEEGASTFMEFMYKTIIEGVPAQVIQMLMELHLRRFNGQYVDKEKLGIKIER